MNVTTRSTKARTWGCRASTSLDSIDFWIFGITPSKVRLTPSTSILVGSAYSRVWSCFSVNDPIGFSIGRPAPAKMRPYQPSML